MCFWSRVSCRVSMRVVFYFPSFLRHCPAVDPQGTSPFICPYIYLYHIANSPSLDVFYKKLPFPFPYYFPMPVLLSPQSCSQYFTPSWMFLTWLTFMAALCFHILQKKCYQTTKYLLASPVEILLQMFLPSSHGLFFGWFTTYQFYLTRSWWIQLVIAQSVFSYW